VLNASTKYSRTCWLQRYEGEWQSDKRHGDGICLYANGDKYEVGVAPSRKLCVPLDVVESRTVQLIKTLREGHDCLAAEHGQVTLYDSLV
jgi:hypothetical protein